MIILGIFIGYWVGKLILGGLYWSLFTHNESPNEARAKRIEANFSILGAILGGIIFASF
ncbi:hypothetical protein [Lutibacter sp.]|uniref:hypothetical protein n=1 Tax=Lutibacter sp. TaxID=1925666 RepID=UPI00356409F7